jgi:L-asparagine transporter-like permease
MCIDKRLFTCQGEIHKPALVLKSGKTQSVSPSADSDSSEKRAGGAETTDQFSRSLKTRHITMISIGGIIGAGLFVGSSTVIAAVGPAVVLSYATAGAIVFLVMRMLGELAVSRPGVPTFTEYTRQILGDCAAFVSGWLYAYFWIIVVAVETIAGALIIQQWLPLPAWAIGLVLLSALTMTNLFSVRIYGEFEFWFASIKVAAIIAFLIAGAGYLLRITSNAGLYGAVSLLHNEGGFAPNGVFGILAGIPAVIFSICGAEIAAIAAAESTEPARNVARIARTIILRILFFYIGSILLIVAIVPWNSVIPGISPFVTALNHINVPFAAQAMTIIILTAVLSCLNSGLYVASRVLHGLATRGDAPALFLHLNAMKSPVAGVIICAVAAFACTVISMGSSQAVFNFLLNASGALMLIVYMLIAAAQIRNRFAMDRAHVGQIPVRMWFFPWASFATVAAMLTIVLAMPFIKGMDDQFFASITATGFAIAVYWVRRRVRGPRGVKGDVP